MAKKKTAAVLDKPEADEPEQQEEAPKQEEAAKPSLSAEQQRIAESREALKHPLPAGQQFFEAPDGFIMLGEAGRSHLIYKRVGKSDMLINPRR